MSATRRKFDFYSLAVILAIILLAEASFEVSNRADEVKYTIKVYTAEEAENMKFEGEMVPMTSSYHQKLNCFLPVEHEYVQETTEGSTERDITKLMAPVGTPPNNCLYRLEGWWTYEFCLFQHVKQMHQENGKILRPQDEIFLGKFVPGSGKEETDHYSEVYDNGTPCDIAKENKRRTTVKYECSPDGPTMIANVREPATCTYSVTISSPHICKHPLYRPKKERVETISCVHVKKGTTREENSHMEEELNEGEVKGLHPTNERAKSRLPKRTPASPVSQPPSHSHSHPSNPTMKKNPHHKGGESNEDNDQKSSSHHPSHSKNSNPDYISQETAERGNTGADKLLSEGKMSNEDLEALRQLQDYAQRKFQKKGNAEEEDDVIEFELTNDEEGTIVEKLRKLAEMSEKIRKNEIVEKFIKESENKSQKEDEEDPEEDDLKHEL